MGEKESPARRPPAGLFALYERRLSLVIFYNKADANRELRKLNGIDAIKSADDVDATARMGDKEFFAELARQAKELNINLKMTFEATVE